MTKSSVFILAVIVLNTVYASEIEPTIPLKISEVKTQLINKKHLVRIIEFNTEHEPKIIIERLARPSIKVLEKLVISKVKLNNKIIDFENSAATSFESIVVEGNDIKFVVDYFYLGKGAGSVLFECKVNVNNENISEPVCSEK